MHPENNPATLVTLLHTLSTCEDKGICFIEGNDKETFYSYRSIYNKAIHLVHFLQQKGLSQGDELVFQLRDNKDFIVTFWACLLAGIVPVPLSMGVSSEQKLKLAAIWKLLTNPYLIIAKADVAKIMLVTDEEKVILLEHITQEQQPGTVYTPKEDDIAYVQFSSGSTGTPKGVVLTHKNLLTNIRAIHKGIHSPAGGDLFYSWMPLTHDMGLIGFHLTPLLAGWSHYIMPTELFIRNPNLWLRKISEHKITFTSSPNFGYKYVLKHISKESAINLDLSSLRIIVNGAEPISASLCAEFTIKLAPYGLGPNVIFPVYGLAEASLAVSFSEINQQVITVNLNRKHLNIANHIVTGNDEANSVSFVSVGKAIDNCFIRITDTAQNILPENYIGEIQVKGGNVTSGYYNNNKATGEVITEDGWLKTGDLGFFKDKRLYITGRQKDVLFVNGQNYYAHDIERSSEAVDGIELGKVVAAGYFDAVLQRERILAFVLYKNKVDEFLLLAAQLKKHINQAFNFEIDEVLPVKEIPKTTSGKVRRYALIENYRNGLYAEQQQRIKELAALQKVTGIAGTANAVEKVLWNKWTELIGHSNFGINDRFFEIGGNSLKAAELMAYVAQEFKVALSFETLFEKQSIAELAGEIIFLPIVVPVVVKKADAANSHQLSAAQKRLYYIWQMDKDATAYNIPQALEISGILDKDRLEKAFNGLVLRHELLRTTYETLASAPEQKLQDNFTFSLNCTAIDNSSIDSYLKSLVKPFNLASLPLFKAELITVSEAHHFLFLDFHHIIADGISIYLFVDELFKIYHGEELPAADFNYNDYINWQAEQYNPEALSGLDAFWIKQLQQEVPVLNLPADYTRPSVLNYAGEKIPLILDNRLTEQLKLLAAKNNVSMHMLLLGIYNIFLAKYTAQQDIVVGVPVSGRYQPAFDKVLGMFVNNLAVRSYPQGNKTFTAFIAEVKQNWLAVVENQNYEFGQLVERLGKSRDMSRNPVFDTMFIYQNMGFPKQKQDDISLSRYFFDPGFSKYDLSLEIFDFNNKLELYLEYATSLFKPETIRQMAGHFKNIINSVVANPDRKIADLSVISNEEQQLFVNKFNATEFEYLHLQAIHELFESIAGQTPDAVAVVDREASYTFKQLNEQANKLAHFMKHSGVVAEDVVALLMDRSAELIIGMLATLKSGACFLPVDPELPASRINLLITNSKTNFVLTKKTHTEKLNTAAICTIIHLDSNTEYSKFAAANPMQKVGLADLAYILYTSGTTGEPKGVMISHHSLVNYSLWAAGTYFKNEKSSMPLYTSVSFDLTITSIFAPLVSGNTIIVYKEDDKELIIQKIISDNRSAVVKLTPSHLKIIASPAFSLNTTNISALKRFIVGGEDLSASLASDIYHKFNGAVEIYNEYGPTEATVGCMIYKFDTQVNYYKSIPIGVPINNSKIYLLDAYLKPVAAGVEAELYIAGNCLAKGYLHQPKLTNERFVPDPFVAGKKMYKTGDVAKRLLNGTIAYVGRSDQQVKINGYRIELSEIEAQLKENINIKDAVVIDRPDKNNSRYLCAYIVLNEPAKNIATEVFRNYLTAKLPAYMVPAFYVQLKSIPLTKNGKVAIAALPEPEKTGTGAALPQNDREHLLLGIWEEVLQVKNIGVNDNFFQLGGDSIKAIQIVSKLYDKGFEATIKILLQHPTIAQFALHITEGNEQQYEQSYVSGEFGFTPVVNWFFMQELAMPHHYNQSVLLEFTQNADQAILEQAMNVLIHHHDALRINLHPANKRLFYNAQHLQNEFKLNIHEDIAVLESDREKYIAQIGETLKGSFNIVSGPLIKAAFIAFKNNRQYLLITAHHLVTDGISWRIFLDDFYTVYKQLQKKEKVKLPPKTASLMDWHAALEQLKSALTVDEQNYWDKINKRLSDVSGSINVVADSSLKNNKTFSSELNKPDTHFLISEAHKQYATSVEIILLTAFMKARYETTGNTHQIIELENHGRSAGKINTSRTMGWFTALFPVALTLEGNGIHEQLIAIKEQVKGIPNNGIGYGLLNYFTDDKPKHFPVAAIRFNYMGLFNFDAFADLFQLSDAYTGNEVAPANNSSANLDIISMIRDGKLSTTFNYNTQVYTEETIAALGAAYTKNIETLLNYLKQEKDIYFTPSDFETVNLKQEEIDALFE